MLFCKIMLIMAVMLLVGIACTAPQPAPLTNNGGRYYQHGSGTHAHQIATCHRHRGHRAYPHQITNWWRNLDPGDHRRATTHQRHTPDTDGERTVV